MRISTIRYTIEQGLRNIVKDKMFSIASIATMSACIFMFGIFYILIVIFSKFRDKDPPKKWLSKTTCHFFRIIQYSINEMIIRISSDTTILSEKINKL